MNATGMGVGMWLVWILIILGAIVVIKLLIDVGGSKSPECGRKAIDILDERYARGDIDADEYKRLKKEIEK